MKKTIGGDRLGTGKQMETDLHNYSRSTHNLSYSWRSSMAPGVLVPFMSIPAMRGDDFDINLQAIARTLPTTGPLFGSFKLQVDVFSIPMRLYQGILHNNPLNIGLKMNQVYLPKIKLYGDYHKNALSHKHISNRQIASNALLRYLGVSGWGDVSVDETHTKYSRKFNAVPILCYYDIFKNYYSNKQEEYCYCINNDEYLTEGTQLTELSDAPTSHWKIQAQSGVISIKESELYAKVQYGNYIRIKADGTNVNAITFISDNIQVASLNELHKMNFIQIMWEETNANYVTFKFTKEGLQHLDSSSDYRCMFEVNEAAFQWNSTTFIQPCKLSNFDDMRYYLLSHNQLGEEVVLEQGASFVDYPYKALVELGVSRDNKNKYPMQGLMLKTYQSDIFNNWVQTEWIDGPNGIAELTAVSTAGGSFTIDQLNLQQKRYNMYNRIAVSGGTYDDWNEAVYGEGGVRRAETPMYMGGMSSEIIFEEVIATAETTGGENKNGTLGSIGGRGTLNGKKGGVLNIHIDEASYIMGIVSITPRLAYSGGNSWDMTEIETIDDLHKPALDAIGFQELMAEQMAYWDTHLQPVQNQQQVSLMRRNSVGKQPCWINYMTNFDKSFGDFADQLYFMTLNRQYDEETNQDGMAEVGDITTYIDPSKYNYVFADASLNAQNFWINIYSHIIARRKMSAKMIPNL